MTEQPQRIEFGDFQTPLTLASEVCSLLHRLNFRPKTIIEPSCGKGSFVEAAVSTFGKGIEYYGFDINPDYVAIARQRLAASHPDTEVILRCQDFFSFDWKHFIEGLPEPVLFLGNPPWVTSATLGALNSENMPQKSNIKRLGGLDALTGKANFDISEWMLLKLMEAGMSHDYAFAFLCKTGVARKILEYQWKSGMPVMGSVLYRIDALKSFNAAVDACLFVANPVLAGGTEHCAPIYQSLNAEVPTATIGMVDGRMVSDVDTIRETSHLNGVNYYRWRSGVKHDLAKVMEIRVVNGELRNGFGMAVEIEETCLYPLLKATEVSKGLTIPERFVLITQHAVGEDTKKLREIAPRTYQYLECYEALFADRKSSIYRGQPKYCLFGVGSYTFAPYKVAISGLHKSPRFSLLIPVHGKPVIVDDTCYFIGSFEKKEATLLHELLNSDVALQFLTANVFAENKRPITADVLNRMDIKKLSEHLGRMSELETFLQTGTVESKGQGMLIFEPAGRYIQGAKKKRVQPGL